MEIDQDGDRIGCVAGGPAAEAIREGKLTERLPDLDVELSGLGRPFVAEAHVQAIREEPELSPPHLRAQ